MPNMKFNPLTQKFDLIRNFFGDDEKLKFGNIPVTPDSSIYWDSVNGRLSIDSDIGINGTTTFNYTAKFSQDPGLAGLISLPLQFEMSDGVGGTESSYLFGLSSSFFTSGQPGIAMQVGGSIRFTLSTDGMEYIPDLAGDSYRFGALASGVGAGTDVTYNAGDSAPFGNFDGGNLYLDAGLPSGTGEHGIVIIKKEKEATALLPTQPSNTFRFISSFWNTVTGVADDKYMTLRAEPISSWYDSAYFYMNADGDDVFAIGKGDFIGVTPFDNGDGTFRFSYGCEYQSTSGVNAPDVNFVGGSCANGTPGELRFIPGLDVASGNVADVVIGTDAYGDKDYRFIFKSSLSEGAFTWDNGNATLEFDSDIKLDKRIIRSKSVYTGTDTTDDIYLHICDSDSAFTLTVTDGTKDGEEIKITNRGVGTVTLSGSINSVTATSVLYSGETIVLGWDVADDEWQ